MGLRVEQYGGATAKQKPWLFYSILFYSEIYSLHCETHETKQIEE